MKRTVGFVLAVFFGMHFCICATYAQEKLSLNAPYDEMQSEIQNSETFVQQLYVQEKRSFDQKISQRKNLNPKVPLYKYKKLAPSADEQKIGIEIVQ